ncbi:MAG: aminomethyltransferase [Pelagibacteraceae bacterium]|nr:aminomethyltransferase [Pelagibacteraceae bacterium]
MIIPSISRPYEPGLPALANNQEQYSVTGNGSIAIKLFSGDKFHILNLEGYQKAEIVCFLENGKNDLSPLGLKKEHNGFLTKSILSKDNESATMVRLKLKKHKIDINAIKESILVFSDEARIDSIEKFTSNSNCICIISAPGEEDIISQGIPATDLRVIVERIKDRKEGEYILPDPLGDPVQEIFIKRQTANSYEVQEGDYIQIIDIYGRQCSDFTAFDANQLQKGKEAVIDTTNSRYIMGGSSNPGLHSKYFTENHDPLVEVIRDTVGRHDTYGIACSSKFYDDHGYFGHPNCSDNFNYALENYPIRKRLGWNAVNLFYNTAIDSSNSIIFDEPFSRPGDYIMFKALKNLVCVSSACPDDIDAANGWNCTDMFVRIYRPNKPYSKGGVFRMKPDSEPKLTKETGFHPCVSKLTENIIDYKGFWLATKYNNNGALQEYEACRERAIIMDLSALRKFEILGPDAEELMQRTCTRNIRKLAVGQVVYTAMCYEHGGMVDDGTVFKMTDTNFRWICGDEYCGEWLREKAKEFNLKVWIKSSTDNLHNVSVQGPKSREILKKITWTPAHQTTLEDLGWFRFTIGNLNELNGIPIMVSRTGYTGELGYEIFCHPRHAVEVWEAVIKAGEEFQITPMGLDALDLVRIEAGLIFANYEFDDQTDPFEAGIGFTVPLKSKEDNFIGKENLIKRKANPQRTLVGLEIEGNELCGHGDCVHEVGGRSQIGIITSGMKSPTLKKMIALCKIDINYSTIDTEVEIGKLDGHQKRIKAKVVRFPFYDPDKSRVRS